MMTTSPTKASWIVDLDAIYQGHPHPLEVAALLRIPRLDTMRVATAIADALLGLCGTTPSLLTDLREHAEFAYTEVINRLMDEYVVLDDYPEDLRGYVPRHQRVYTQGVLDMAIALVGHVPQGSRQLGYICQVHGQSIWMSLRMEDPNERLACIRGQASASALPAIT